MNIAEILKDCPRGTKLYSPVYGEVYLLYVENSNYPIRVETCNDSTASITSNGRLDANYDGECMLFPSKDNRDWSTFKVQKEKEHEFKLFEKVLVRDDITESWHCDLFSHYVNKYFVCTGGSWKQCISYVGNEHLLGTTNNLN